VVPDAHAVGVVQCHLIDCGDGLCAAERVRVSSPNSIESFPPAIPARPHSRGDFRGVVPRSRGRCCQSDLRRCIDNAAWIARDASGLPRTSTRPGCGPTARPQATAWRMFSTACRPADAPARRGRTTGPRSRAANGARHRKIPAFSAVGAAHRLGVKWLDQHTQTAATGPSTPDCAHSPSCGTVGAQQTEFRRPGPRVMPIRFKSGDRGRHPLTVAARSVPSSGPTGSATASPAGALCADSSMSHRPPRARN